MTERPILFNGPNVRALLAGSKTQTRCVVKPQPFLGRDDQPVGLYSRQCPYGQSGDRLWIREALAFKNWGVESALLTYEADGSTVIGIPVNAPMMTRPRRTAMLMPRWASRITLEVTGVRVERLQDISDDDVQAEGVRQFARWNWRVEEGDHPNESADRAYQALWNKINAKRAPWASNPWVWVVSFRRLP